MKHILVPIDFSKSSENALIFALSMARKEKAKVTVLHIVSPFGGLEEGVLQVYDFSVYLEEKRKSMVGYMDRIQTKYGFRRIKVDLRCESGQSAEGILHFADSIQVDLIIMGSRGGSNISKILLGSTSQAIVSLAKIPVLIIPPDFRMEDYQAKICFATDYHLKLNKAARNLFDQYDFLAKAQIIFVHVHNAQTPVYREKHAALVDLIFPKIKSKLKYIESDQFEESIDNYMRSSESGMLILLPHEHYFLFHLFFRGHTLPIVKKLRYPILILHELN